jgi:transcriptional regulator with XRE-family HTH domain
MLNKALKLLRMYHNVKACALAKKLDVAPSFISEIEFGKKKASTEMLFRYGEVFKMKPSDIMLFAEKLAAKKGLEDHILKTIKKTIAEY